jgi:hypothetical protein
MGPLLLHLVSSIKRASIKRFIDEMAHRSNGHRTKSAWAPASAMTEFLFPIGTVCPWALGPVKRHQDKRQAMLRSISVQTNAAFGACAFQVRFFNLCRVVT